MDRIEFKKFAGVRINGITRMPKPSNLSRSHLARASYLTAQVESGGRYGTVISYDGTGITAGIHQAVAIYPANVADKNVGNDQGPLWRLLYSLKDYWEKNLAYTAPFPESAASPNFSWPMFETGLAAEGWLLASSGLFHLDTLRRVSGQSIRETFVGSADGVMPVAGQGRKMAETWADIFHKLFSSEWTFETQLAFGDSFFAMDSIKKLRFCSKGSLRETTIAGYFYEGKDIPVVTPDFLGGPLDLALSVYWSNSVNAPSYALKVLCKVADNYVFARDPLFAKALISALGNSSFGRWDDDIPNGRYQRTRKAAMSIWPIDLFEGPSAVMPKDLVG